MSVQSLSSVHCLLSPLHVPVLFVAPAGMSQCCRQPEFRLAYSAWLMVSVMSLSYTVTYFMSSPPLPSCVMLQVCCTMVARSRPLLLL